MKYIPAEKLKAEIERRKNQTERRLDNIVPIRRKDTMDEEQLAKIELRDKVDKAYLNGVLITLSNILSLITSLQQEPRFPQYDNIVDKVFGAGNLESFEYRDAEMLVALAKEELLKSLQQEQPEVDLEKEIDKMWNNGLSDELAGPHNNFDVCARLARHFFNLGLNARKE